MDKIKLAVDLDNVCADLIAGFIAALGVRPLRTDRPSLERMFPYVESAILNEIIVSPYVYKTLKPIEGAASNLHWLVEMGVYIEYVTARSKECTGVSKDWLKAHKFPYPDRVVTLDGNKVEYIKAQGFTAAIDDIHSVLSQLFTYVPRLYLYNQPWNQGPGPFKRVNSWPEFFKVFRAEVLCAV